MTREGEIVEGDYEIETGSRRYKVYLLTESELNLLVWAPWRWQRRRIINRVKAETTFDDGEVDTVRLLSDLQPSPNGESAS